MADKGIVGRQQRLWARCLDVLPFWRRDLENLLFHGWHALRSAQCVFVDPRDIRRYVNWGPGLPRMDTGRVIDGDWDLAVRPLASCEKLAVVMRKLERSISWEEAGAYARMLRVIKRRPGTDGCYGLDDVKERYTRLDEVIFQIEKEGRLRTRRELSRWNFREMGGVLVHIGRAGEPIFGCGGAHRLAVSRYLGFSIIPCQVGVVHAEAVRSGAFRRLSCRREPT